MKKLFCVFLVFCFALSGCKDAGVKEGLSVVATNFPAYDFAREVTGGNAEIKMLIKPGGDVHSYEPSPSDIIAISECDLFIYTGGENDSWVSEILENSGNINAVCMMDCVEVVEGDHEADSHVWTSPLNAAKIAERICDELCVIDSANTDAYKKNTDCFKARLYALDKEFAEITENAPKKVMVFADRFPVRYFTERYSLSFESPFSGCAHDTEASPAAVARIIDIVRNQKIPVVFYGEMSDRRLAEAVTSETGAKMRLFHSCHNLSKEDFEGGVTYLELMNSNKVALKEALGV